MFERTRVVLEPEVNAHEDAARLRKAARLADELEARCLALRANPVSTAEAMTEDAWELLGDVAKIARPASKQTREMTVQMLRERAERRAKAKGTAAAARKPSRKRTIVRRKR